MNDIVQVLVKVTAAHKKMFDELSQELRLSKSEILRLLIELLDKERLKESSTLIDYLYEKGEFRSVTNRITR